MFAVYIYYFTHISDSTLYSALLTTEVSSGKGRKEGTEKIYRAVHMFFNSCCASEKHEHSRHWFTSWLFSSSSTEEAKYVNYVLTMALILLELQPNSRSPSKKWMKGKGIPKFLLRNKINWIGLNFNTPTASHKGGLWEQQIRSCFFILSSLLRNHSHSLNDESFRRVNTEVESIVKADLCQ